MPNRRRDLPSLDLLRGFEAAARHRSFTLAAKELFLTQSAISRQIQALETHLGVPLFERRHRSLRLTDDGQRLYQTAGQVLRQVREAVDQIGTQRSRMVTVTTLVTFASLWLVPRLPDFRKQHPGIDVHISADNSLVQMARSRIDVAIRYVPPALAPVGARPLFEEQVLPVCAPSLLQGRKPLRDAAELKHWVLLHMDDAPVVNPYLDWAVWLQAAGQPGLQPEGALYFSHYDQMIQAAVEGQGIVLGRLPLISRQIEQGRLVPAFAKRKKDVQGAPVSRSYFVLTAPQAGEREEVQAFLHWLESQACPRLQANKGKKPKR